MPKREQRIESEPVTTVMRDKNSLRCCCGSLLARLVPGGVELKCCRCKRQVVIPILFPNKLEIYEPSQRPEILNPEPGVPPKSAASLTMASATSTESMLSGSSSCSGCF